MLDGEKKGKWDILADPEKGEVWVEMSFYDLLEGAKIQDEKTVDGKQYYLLEDLPRDEIGSVFGMGSQTPRCKPPGG